MKCFLPVASLSSEAQPTSRTLGEMLLLGLETREMEKPCFSIMTSALALSSDVRRRWAKSIPRKWFAASS